MTEPCMICGQPATWTSPTGHHVCDTCRDKALPPLIDGPELEEGEVGATPDFDARVVEELDKLRIRDTALRLFRVEQQLPAAPPSILTLRERLANPQPEVEWRVEGWQPQGTRVMLAAQFKAGKTTLTGNLARCLVDGDWWLETAAVTKVNGGTVTIIDFEMGERQIDGWLQDQGIKNDDRILIIPLRGRSASFDIINDTVRHQWVERLAGTEYLILDCLRPILDALGLDEHHDGGRFLTALDALCTETGIQDLLVVHHMGHTGERSRGDSRFRDWPDVEWRLVREEDDPASPRYISAYGRDVDVPESELAHNPVTRHLKVVGGNRGNALARRALDDILDYLEDCDEPASTKTIEADLIADTEHSRNAIREGLKIGVRDAQIHREKGPRNTHLHTLNSPTRRNSPADRRSGPFSSPNPIGGGELEHPFGEHLEEVKTPPLPTPEEDPW